MIKYEPNKLCVLMPVIFKDLTSTNTFEMKQKSNMAYGYIRMTE